MAGNAIVLWTLGGAGVVLLYAAVKDVPATKVLTGEMFHANAVASPAGNGVPGTGTNNKANPVSFSSDGSAGYWKGTDPTGTNYIYNGSGAVVGTVPQGAYSQSPGTYIMST